VRLQIRFEHAFERFRARYRGLLERCLHQQRFFLIAFFTVCVLSLVFLIPWLGQDFFPTVDSGQFKLHVRARTGTRIEETARLCDLVEQSIREQIPNEEVASIIDNIGLPSPIDIQIVGNDLEGNRRFADNLLQKVRYVPGTVDLRIQQPSDQPKLNINVDRTKAGQIGYTERDVAQNLLISLSGSFQTTPTFWLNPKNGVSYPIATQTPQYRIDSLQGLQNIPVSSGG